MITPIFDRVHFDHMTGGDRALQAEILGLFRGQVANWRVGLTSDAPGWKDAAHMLKGSARGIGLERLALACERAENEGGEAALSEVRAELDAALAAMETPAANVSL